MDLDDWQSNFQRNTPGTVSSHRAGAIDESDRATGGFVELLVQLGAIFLQDSASFIYKHPEHAMGAHPVFDHPNGLISPPGSGQLMLG